MRLSIAILLAALGCGDSGSSTDGGSDSSRDAPAIDSAIDAAPCGECDTVDFSVEVDGETLTDGLIVDWVWGFQGGTMITPTLVFDAGVTEGETVEVVVTHAPDPEAPELFGEAADFQGPFTYFFDVWRNDGRLIVGPINDQLGWVDLDGMRLIHEVEVRAARGTTTRTAAIELAESEPSPCDAFELESGGCAYYLIPGSVSVSVGEPDPIYSSCTDARGVTLTFTADAADDAIACADTTPFGLITTQVFMTSSSYNPPASCLDGVGLTEGATLPATWRLIRSGTCNPSYVTLDVDTSACDEMCL